MSWHFSQALVAAYSEENSWDGEPCAPLSVMPTPHKFWRSDKPLEPSDLSRFGLTCAALTEDRGADLLTWFREASLAKTSALRAKAQDLPVVHVDGEASYNPPIGVCDVDPAVNVAPSANAVPPDAPPVTTLTRRLPLVSSVQSVFWLRRWVRKAPIIGLKVTSRSRSR